MTDHTRDSIAECGEREAGAPSNADRGAVGRTLDKVRGHKGPMAWVEVDHLNALLDFCNSLVARGIHVHAKVWALTASIPEEGE